MQGNFANTTVIEKKNVVDFAVLFADSLSREFVTCENSSSNVTYLMCTKRMDCY
jgi:hypothetical protein